MFRRTLILIGLILGLTLSAHAQGVFISGQAVVNTPTSVPGIPGNSVLQAVPNAQITVCASTGGGIPCSPLVTIYSNAALTVVAPNPFTADANGNWGFYITPSTSGYLASQTGSGVTGQLFVISPSLASGGSGNPAGSSGQVQFNNLGVFGGASGITTPDGNSLSIKGPDPFVDCTAYGCVSSTATFGATCNATSPNVTLTATYSAPNTLPGDWKNGQYISLFGCGPLATVQAPNVNPISISSISRLSGVVTATVSSIGPIQTSSYVQVIGVTDSTYNGVFFTTGGNGTTTLTWNQAGANTSSSGGTLNQGMALYEGTNPGTTTYTYNVCAVGHNGGCSAKSATLTVTNGPATLTALDNIWVYFGFQFPGASGAPGDVDYLCVYRNNSFLGRTYMPAFNDDGTVWNRNLNCPSTPPSTATADLLKTTIVSGAGTNNLVLATSAVTSNTAAFTFHDNQLPIMNAIAAAATSVANGPIGGPEVILPSGHYLVSRLQIGGVGPPVQGYTLDATGIIEPVTHPIVMSYNGTLIGHSHTASQVIFNIDNQVEIATDSSAFYTPQSLQSEMDGMLFEGGNQTVRGASTSIASASHDLIFANIPTTGTSSVTIDNFSGQHSVGGDCLYANANVIFAKIYNFKCNAASVELGAPVNRYSIYLTNVWNSGQNVSVDWEVRDFALFYGAVKVDSPAPNAGQGISAWKFGKWSQLFTESVRSKGMFTVDTGCTNSPFDTRVGILDNIQEFFIGADQAAYKGEYYIPRAGTTGCAAPNIAGLVGNDVWNMPRGSDPTVGADLPLSITSSSVSSWDGNILPADQDLNLGETRTGAKRQIVGGQFFMNFPNNGNGDVPEAAILIPPPTFTITNGGAGGSCASGITYFFALSQGDGIGWTKITPQTQETSASTGAGGQIITINYAPAFASPVYRIWYGTTSGGENSYFQTTNQTSFNFGCGTPTGTGTPQIFSTAYWLKFASEGGVDSWLGLGSGDHFGIGKKPSLLGTIYTLDVGGPVNADGQITESGQPVALVAPVPLAIGSSTGNVVVAPNGFFVCTAACTVTPPVPAAGDQFCVMNDDNVSSVITLGALGSGAQYENTARTAYGTAGTGTFTSAGAVGDQVCIIGRDPTHYLTKSFTGTWTAH